VLDILFKQLAEEYDLEPDFKKVHEWPEKKKRKERKEIREWLTDIIDDLLFIVSICKFYSILNCLSTSGIYQLVHGLFGNID